MTTHEAPADRASGWLVEGRAANPDPAWTVEWVDPVTGQGILRRDGERVPVLVEGGPRSWVVTLAGRRIRVDAHGPRERLLAMADAAAGRVHRPTEVRAALPGLVVRVRVSVGDTVAEGDALVSMEAMKMQNEIRAPRAGLVVGVSVTPGQAVAAGAALVELADLDP